MFSFVLGGKVRCPRYLEEGWVGQDAAAEGREAGSAVAARQQEPEAAEQWLEVVQGLHISRMHLM